MGCRIVFAWRDISSIWRQRDEWRLFYSEILLRRIVSNNRRSSATLPEREKRTLFRNGVFEIVLAPGGMENYSDTRVFLLLFENLTNRKNGS